MGNKYRVAYFDEEEGWQTTAYGALNDEFELLIPQSMPKSVSDIWTLINEFGTQAVVLDYRLNGSGTVAYTGDDAVNEIRKHNEYLPVFIITSYEDDAIVECKETQSIRGKSMFTDSKVTLIHMIKSSIGIYDCKKNEMEKILLTLQEKIDQGCMLTEEEKADRFDAELYLSLLDKDSSVRGNMIRSDISEKLDNMIALAKEIVANYKKD